MKRVTQTVQVLVLCQTMLAVAGCAESKEIYMPVVTEESLNEEQKAALERRRSIEAGVLRNAGAESSIPANPADFAQQQFEAYEAHQASQKNMTVVGNAP